MQRTLNTYNIFEKTKIGRFNFKKLYLSRQFNAVMRIDIKLMRTTPRVQNYFYTYMVN